MKNQAAKIIKFQFKELEKLWSERQLVDIVRQHQKFMDTQLTYENFYIEIFSIKEQILVHLFYTSYSTKNMIQFCISAKFTSYKTIFATWNFAT